MIAKKEICRMDALTREIHPKSELFRIVMKDGYLTLDLNQDLPGRGIYICKNKETIEKAFRRGIFRKYASAEALEALHKELTEHAE